MEQLAKQSFNLSCAHLPGGGGGDVPQIGYLYNGHLFLYSSGVVLAWLVSSEAVLGLEMAIFSLS